MALLLHAPDFLRFLLGRAPADCLNDAVLATPYGTRPFLVMHAAYANERFRPSAKGEPLPGY
jgi:hypothetical protein